MILVDTSVWIDHFRGTGEAEGLAEALEENEVLLHPAVLGELALGGLGPDREPTLADLRRLPTAPVAQEEEVLRLVLERRLFGLGIGWVDSHLLASSLVAGSELWTLDRRLRAAAARLGVTPVAAAMVNEPGPEFTHRVD